LHVVGSIVRAERLLEQASPELGQACRILDAGLS
jgi:hypothetical protein